MDIRDRDFQNQLITGKRLMPTDTAILTKRLIDAVKALEEDMKCGCPLSAIEQQIRELREQAERLEARL